MSQVIAGCCCTSEPPPPSENCCVDASGLPSTVSVSVQIQTQVSIQQFKTGVGGCGGTCPESIDYAAPAVYRNVTVTGNIVLWRWDNEFGIGCTYYPRGGSSFTCTDEYGSQYTVDNGYAPSLTPLYADDYFAAAVGQNCGNVLRGAIPVAGGIWWAQLEKASDTTPNLSNGFYPSNANASQTCACWRLSVQYALTPLRNLFLQCPSGPSDDRTYDRFFVYDDTGSPVVVAPVIVAAGSGVATDDQGVQTRYSHCGVGVASGGSIQALRNTSSEVVNGKWKPSTLRGEYRTMLAGPAGNPPEACQGNLAVTGTRMTATIS